MHTISRKYWAFHRTPSDINEHLPVLANLAAHCGSVFESGVRGMVSSYALAHGLLNNCYSEKRLVLNDIVNCPVQQIIDEARGTPLCIEFCLGNNLQLTLSRAFDMVFIDTWHVYAQLSRELEKFKSLASKFIVLHDTTIDGVDGESVRFGMDIQRQSQETGFPAAEIARGLWPAVEDFLRVNEEWVLVHRFEHNNGLTILSRSAFAAEACRAIAFQRL